MLEKIGLQGGNNWVVDGTHCQGCSSQFTFIYRKHHCRRCGGLFCNACTRQRMVLCGHGDSPVRICEPCKKLEEAARFEMRHGHENKTRRGTVLDFIVVQDCNFSWHYGSLILFFVEQLHVLEGALSQKITGH
ncbi:hypothetical protein CsSME_00030710 [Camellia sinensis var. sinensis]